MFGKYFQTKYNYHDYLEFISIKSFIYFIISRFSTKQVGCAVGFLLPPVLVPYSEDLNQIGKDIGTMFYMGAGVTTFFFIMVILSKSNIHTL